MERRHPSVAFMVVAGNAGTFRAGRGEIAGLQIIQSCTYIYIRLCPRHALRRVKYYSTRAEILLISAK